MALPRNTKLDFFKTALLDNKESLQTKIREAIKLNRQCEFEKASQLFEDLFTNLQKYNPNSEIFTFIAYHYAVNKMALSENDIINLIDAEKLLLQTVEIASKNSYKNIEMHALSSLGECHLLFDQIDSAIKDFLKAITLMQKDETYPVLQLTLIKTLFNISICYTLKNESENAKRYSEEANTLLSKIEKKSEESKFEFLAEHIQKIKGQFLKTEESKSIQKKPSL